MMDYVNKIVSILSKGKYARIFCLLFILFGLVFAISADIIIFPTFELNPIAEPVKIVAIASIVFLATLNFTVILHNYDSKKKSNKSNSLFGVITALFTTACPVCQPVWLFWIGFGSATAFLADISIYIATLSIVLLLISLRYALSDKCEVKSYGKKA